MNRRSFAVSSLVALGAAVGCSAPSASDATAGGAGGAATGTSAASSTAGTGGASAVPDPIVPLGIDALRRWDRLPVVRIGVRAEMKSTFDRAGGNPDVGHFIRQAAAGDDVVVDVAGPGVLAFWRANHWHGSPWRYAVDGEDHIVAESSTADPTHPVASSVFLPSAAFPPPLAVTWSTTKGADLSWVPVPFERSFELAYGRTHYGTGYGVLLRVPEGAPNLMTPIAAWREEPPPADVLDLFARAGEDIAPRGPATREATGSVDVAKGAVVPLVDLPWGPSTIRALTLRAPAAHALDLSGVRLRVTWDDRALPSIDAPLPLLFGAGTLFNRAGRRVLVGGLLATVVFDGSDVVLALYFPMPFARRAHLELVGGDVAIPGVRYAVRGEPTADPPGHLAYFHATYVDHGAPVAGEDLVLLDTRDVEGGGPQCGSFVGTSFVFSDRADLGTLEGDPRFFFDDSETPQAQGTGTEEWAGGGDYWGGQTMTLPLVGHPVGAPSAADAQGPLDEIESAYRFLVADAMPFGARARIQLEHGGRDDSTEHYKSVAYWYGLPSACLVESDALHVGDAGDEAAHGYDSPTASPPEAVSGRFELGVDAPVVDDTGRHMTGTTTFTLAIPPDNLGLLLRRRFDLTYPDQRVDVEIADGAGGPFAPAGVWYAAGSNTCVLSSPPGELDPPASSLQTTDRRLREDEFLVPRQLTQGRSSIRVRLRNTAAPRPILPGVTPPAGVWSELRYTCFAYALPSAP